MLVGFAEGLGAAKTYAARDHYEIDANRELLGLGAREPRLRPVAAGWSSTAASRRPPSTARPARASQLSGLVVAALTVVTLLFLTGLFEELPEATLAAVVIAAVIELVDIAALVALYRVYTRALGRAYGVAARPDFIAAVAAMLGVLSSTRCPACSSASASRSCCCSTAPRGRTSPCSAACPDADGPVRRRRRATRERAAARDRRPARRERPVLRQRRRASATRIRARRASRRHDAVVLDAETVPSST